MALVNQITGRRQSPITHRFCRCVGGGVRRNRRKSRRIFGLFEFVEENPIFVFFAFLASFRRPRFIYRSPPLTNGRPALNVNLDRPPAIK